MNEALKSAALSILRPFVRYLIGQGWTYGALAELLKFVYVGEAIRHYGQISGRPLTDSRISLLSGIHRKEVRRLRLELHADPGRIALRHGANVAAQMVAAWSATEAYRDPAGVPRVLPLRAEGMPSFEGLVRLVKADMRPRTILDDLLRAGIVVLDGDNVRLVRSGYVSDLPDDRVAFLGANVGDHLQSAVHNMEGTEPYLEQAVYFEDLPADAMEGIRRDLRAMGTRLLQEAHQRISKSENPEPNRPRRRMRLGVYYYEEDQTSDETPEGNGDAHEND